MITIVKRHIKVGQMGTWIYNKYYSPTTTLRLNLHKKRVICLTLLLKYSDLLESVILK